MILVLRFLTLYRSCDLDKLDQEEMLKIRDAWFEEVGGPPIGNRGE